MSGRDDGRDDEGAKAGFPIARLDTAALEIVFKTLTGGPPPRGRVAKQRDALRALLRDGERWDAWLDALPPLALIAFELLVEAGGGVKVEELARVLARRFGSSEKQGRAACNVLFKQQLVVPLGRDPKAVDPDAMSVFQGTLPLLEARVRGLSLPERPPELVAESEHETSDAGLCRMLAVAGLMAHRTLGFTQSGAPHRGTLKRFTKGLGISQDEAFEFAERARRRGLLGAYRKRLLPRARAMLVAACEGPTYPELSGWLEPGTWVSEQALVRAVMKACIGASPAARPDGASANVILGIDGLDDRSQAIVELLEGLERRTLDGEVWLRRSPAQPDERSGDGHVTPGFEVMLGPAAHPEIVATIALGCELQRIDRVLTFRITPESVKQGRAAGLREGELGAALAVVGRNPVPESVAQLVGEWEQASRVAPVARGWFLFAGPELAPLLEKGELATYLLGSPMEGVLELAPTTPHDALEAALAEHRLTPALRYPLEQAIRQRESGRLESPRLDGPRGPRSYDRQDEDETWVIHPDDEEIGEFDEFGEDDEDRRETSIFTEFLAGIEPPWPLEPDGSPALRERVACARAKGFAGDAAAELLLPAGLEGAPDATPAEIVARVAVMDRAIGGLEAAASRELDRFARRLRGPDRAALEEARDARLPLIPFLVLKPKWRRRIVQTADDLDQLLEITEEVFDLRRVTPAGREVIEILEDPLTQATLRAAMEGADEFDQDEDSSVPSAASAPRDAGRLPRADAFPDLARFDLMARLSGVVQSRRPVYLLCEAGGRISVRHVRPDRIEIQGSRQVLLCRDCETWEDRALPVQEIRSLMGC